MGLSQRSMRSRCPFGWRSPALVPARGRPGVRSPRVPSTAGDLLQEREAGVAERTPDRRPRQRAPERPGAYAGMLALQRSAGNAAVAAMLAPPQPEVAPASSALVQRCGCGCGGSGGCGDGAAEDEKRAPARPEAAQAVQRAPAAGAAVAAGEAARVPAAEAPGAEALAGARSAASALREHPAKQAIATIGSRGASAIASAPNAVKAARAGAPRLAGVGPEPPKSGPPPPASAQATLNRIRGPPAAHGAAPTPEGAAQDSGGGCAGGGCACSGKRDGETTNEAAPWDLEPTPQPPAGPAPPDHAASLAAVRESGDRRSVAAGDRQRRRRRRAADYRRGRARRRAVHGRIRQGGAQRAAREHEAARRSTPRR